MTESGGVSGGDFRPCQAQPEVSNCPHERRLLGSFPLNPRIITSDSKDAT